MKKINKKKVFIGTVFLILISILGFYIWLELSLYPTSKEPLNFSAVNYDTVEHELKVEIFKPSQEKIFEGMYSIGPFSAPQHSVSIGGITQERGEYIFKVTLDNNFTKTQTVYAGDRFGLIGISITGSSEVSITSADVD